MTKSNFNYEDSISLFNKSSSLSKAKDYYSSYAYQSPHIKDPAKYDKK